MKILCFLHFRYANSEDVIFTRKALNEQIRGINPRIINFALESLVIDKRVDTEDVEEDEVYVTGYMISRAGIAWVEALHDDEYVEISQGINFLGEEDEQDSQPSNETHTPLKDEEVEIPASDRVVSLNHNSADYKKAIKTLDEVLQEFKKDHKLDNELGPEKIGLVQILQGARELLNDYKIGLQLAIGAIVKPLERLKEIATKHEGVTWGAFVNAALNAIQKLLGIG